MNVLSFNLTPKLSKGQKAMRQKQKVSVLAISISRDFVHKVIFPMKFTELEDAPLSAVPSKVKLVQSGCPGVIFNSPSC